MENTAAWIQSTENVGISIFVILGLLRSNNDNFNLRYGATEKMQDPKYGT